MLCYLELVVLWPAQPVSQAVPQKVVFQLVSCAFHDYFGFYSSGCQDHLLKTCDLQAKITHVTATGFLENSWQLCVF